MSHTHGPPPGPPRPGGELFPILSPAQSATAVDPVCGMTVDPANAPATAVHDGRTYYFCCPSCRQRFEADPQRYLDGKPSHPEPVAAPAAGVEYYCPMDPDVVSDRPGSCPKCGMA